MPTGSLSSQQAEVGSAGMSSIKHQMLEQMKTSKEYRHGFVEEAVRSRIVGQITALRKERDWDLKTFAAQIGKKVSWAYRLEDPNSAPPTIPSLLEVAEACDIGLDVRFRSFSELLTDVTTLTPASFLVPSFDAELRAGTFAFRRPRIRRQRVRKLRLVAGSGSRRKSSPPRKPPSTESRSSIAPSGVTPPPGISGLETNQNNHAAPPYPRAVNGNNEATGCYKR